MSVLLQTASTMSHLTKPKLNSYTYSTVSFTVWITSNLWASFCFEFEKNLSKNWVSLKK